MARRSRADIEATFYDVFAGWSKEDRTAALKVLAALHRALPDGKVAKVPEPDQPMFAEAS